MLGICPICGATREKYEYNKNFPFCSERCKFIDLWNWFDEKYSFECSIDEPIDEYDQNEK